MIIKHFNEVKYAKNIDELLEILYKRYNNANEFWLSDDPCLAILVNKSPGFQSVGKK